MSKTKRKSPGRDERGRFTKDTKIGEATRFAKENAESCKYKPEYADELIEYFSKPNVRVEYAETFNKDGVLIKRVPVVFPAEYPTFEGFAAKLGVTRGTLLNWCEQSPRFEHAYARAKEMQMDKLICNTMTGHYNPLFAKFEAVNHHGMNDKVEKDNTVHFDVKLTDEVDEESN